MNENIVPTISVCIKRPTIRIYKTTIHLLGDPSHILLLINPQEHSIIISPSNEFDTKSLYVAKYLAKDKKSVELYSTELIQKLIKCNSWNGNNSFKMFGKYIKNEDVVKFDMTQAFPIAKQGLNNEK